MKSSILKSAGFAFILAAAHLPAAEPGPSASLEGPAQTLAAVKSGDRVTVTVAGRPFTEYVFPDDEKYPYFYPVNGPRTARTVTVKRQKEYPHHSSVFFGCDFVNGGNYWQEGLDRGRIIAKDTRLVSAKGDRVVIEQDCSWERPGAASPFMDHRVITISAPSPDIRFIDFEVTLKPRIPVKISKTNHSLFSVRASPELAPAGGGELVNANGERGEKATFGKKADWATFRGKRDGTTEGVAIFNSPKNRWAPTPWFMRDYGFMSPTPMFWPEGAATELAPGDDVKLSYRVVVYGGTLDEAALKRLFDEWVTD